MLSGTANSDDIRSQLSGVQSATNISRFRNAEGANNVWFIAGSDYWLRYKNVAYELGGICVWRTSYS
jgi:hypothetical protein